MPHWTKMGCIAAGICLVATGVRAAPPSSNSGAVVLVLDASGSMRERLGNQTRMEAARAVTRQLLTGWSQEIPIGLTAYGHRSESECTDIEAVVPIGKLQQTSFFSAVDGLQPKGKTPLAAAVENAASQLGYAKNKGTVILISDGAESCGGDPCALAAKLKKEGLDFTAHVVGLGLSSARRTKTLSCIADNTGGQYRAARDSAELKEILGEMFDEVNRRSGLPPSRPSLRLLEEQTAPGAAVKFRAVRVPGGAPIASSWRIYSEDGAELVERSGNKKAVNFRLKPGNYRVVAAYPGVRLDLPFEVSAGKNPVIEVAFNSARLTLAGFMMEGGAAIASRFAIQSPDGQREIEFSPHKQQANFELFPGKYRVVATLNNARVERAIDLSSGDELAHSMNLDVGLATFQAVTRSGGEPVRRTTFTVHEVGSGGSAGKRIAGDPGKAVGEFTLAQGQYLLRVKSPAGNAEMKFSVHAGKQSRQEILVRP